MIRKVFFVLTSLVIPVITYSQFWPGYETGRFTGTSSANTRPGSMAPNPYKIDATLGALHIFTNAGNPFSSEAVGVIFTGGFKNLIDYSKLSSSNTLVFSNMQGPSILATINPKVAIAFTWNIRFMWASRLSAPKLSSLFDDETSSLNIDGSGEEARLFFNGWNEYCLGAGGQIWKKSYHSMGVGGFVKFVTGIGDLRMHIENASVRTSGNNIQSLSFDLDGAVSEQMLGLVDNGSLNLVDRVGVGFDIGAAYRFENPRSCPGASNHRIKAGFSLTDIGFARYTTAMDHSENNVSADDVSVSVFRESSFEATLDTLKSVFNLNAPRTGDEYKLMLPMSLRLYLEANFGKRLLIYGEFHFMFTQLTDPNMPLVFRFNLTPRFEDYQWGVYLPLTFSNYIPANAGLALRWKPFIIGSGNLFTFWAYQDRKQALDFYIAIKIPIVQDNERIDYRAWKR